MKFRLILTLILTFFFITHLSYGQKKAIIIDHNCCDITKVPDNYVSQAKSQFRIAYGHTSHGSQIPSGMSLLAAVPNSIYIYNKGTGSLYLNDASALPGDLGNPDRTSWATSTRNALNNNTLNINMIMWSWCGQVDGSESDINTYLTLMNQLELDFPNITFVYMTGHLNGTGVTGNVNKRNEQIRKFCLENNKTLFDFADIESYDPDGKYFLDKNADDGCNYNGGNWAEEWCTNNPGKCGSCSCAHSQCLNCQQKGKAFWWMMARLAGWEGISTDYTENNVIKSNIEIFPVPAQDKLIINIDNFKTENINITISDNLGISILEKSYININGSNVIEINTSELATGLYYCTIKSGDYTQTRKVLIIK
jgi:hypothetical protein